MHKFTTRDRIYKHRYDTTTRSARDERRRGARVTPRKKVSPVSAGPVAAPLASPAARWPLLRRDKARAPPRYRWEPRRSSRAQPWRATRAACEAWRAAGRRRSTEFASGGEFQPRRGKPPERERSPAIGPRVR